MRRVCLVLVVSIALFSVTSASLWSPFPVIPFVSASGSTDYPWTMFHYNTLRTGASPASAPSTANLMWTHTTGAQVYASPAVVDGLVFISSWDGNLYALNEFSGQVKWTFSTSGPIFGSPAVANGIVYVGSKDGIVYALKEQTGGVVWRTGNPNYPITSSVLVADGKVFYGNWCGGSLCNPPGHFEALDANSGLFLWTNQEVANAPVISSPSIDNGVVFFGENDGSVAALNETTGQAVWRVNPGGAGNPQVVSSAPAIANGRVFVGTGDRFVALNELTGSTIWTFNTGGNNATSGAVNGNVVYFGTGRGNVYAVNAATGAQIWSATTGAAVNSSPALATGSNTLLVGSNDHFLYQLNMANGARVWRYPTGGPIWSSPAVADGRVFFGSQDSAVYGLGVKLPPLHVTVSSSRTTLKPGDVTNITITVTNGTAPVTANLTSTSSSGGGFSPPVMKSLGVYVCNYTAPLIYVPTTATIQAVASRTGFLDGTGITTINLIPFPALTVFVSAKPASVTPGGDVILEILVENGSQPVPGATITPASSQGGAFSSVTDYGNGNYSLVFSAGLQNSNPTLTLQASKPNFSSGQAQVSVTVGGFPDLTSAKIGGIPIYLIILGIVVMGFMIFLAVVRQKKNEAFASKGQVPNYALGRSGWPGRLN